MCSASLCPLIQKNNNFRHKQLEYLSTQISALAQNLFQSSLCKVIQENNLYFLGLKLVIFHRLQKFQIFNLLEIVI